MSNNNSLLVNFLKKKDIDNIMAIDVNTNNYTSYSVIDGEHNEYFKIFDKKEKTPVSNTLKNKKKRKENFFNTSSKILRTNYKKIHKHRKELKGDYKLNPVYLAHCLINKSELPNINLVIDGVSYSDEDAAFYIISLWMLSNRGAQSQKSKIKLSAADKKITKKISQKGAKAINKKKLEDIIKSIPIDLEYHKVSHYPTIRSNKINMMFNPDDLSFFNQTDNKEFYIDIISKLGGKYSRNARKLANIIFYNKNQNKRKNEKRGNCSFLNHKKESQKRGDKNNPYQELRITHLKLNTSNEKDIKELNDEYKDKFIKKLTDKSNNGFINSVIVDILKYKPFFNNDELLFKNSKSSKLSIEDVANIFSSIYDSYESGKPLKSFKKFNLSVAKKDSILEYFEESGSIVSDVSDKFARIYSNFLFKGRINRTGNMLNLLVLNKVYSTDEEYDKNRACISNKKINDIKTFVEDYLGLQRISEIDNIIDDKSIKFRSNGLRANLKFRIQNHINSVLSKKWTDPNVQQKMFLMVDDIMNIIFSNKPKNRTQLIQGIEKIRNIDYVIESTRAKPNKEENAFEHIFNRVFKNVSLNEYPSNNHNRSRILYESGGVDVYDGKPLSLEDTEKDHVVPRSWVTSYGNNIPNLVPCKHTLNNKKDNNLPLSSDLNLNKSEFKKQLNNIYGSSRIDDICEDISIYIEEEHNGKFYDNDVCYIDSYLDFYHKEIDKKGNVKANGKFIKIDKYDFKSNLVSYFKKKINILLMESSKDELEMEFGSSLLSNISHSVSALTDILTDVFGVDRSKISYTPREFSYIGKMRGKRILDLPKDRDWNQHHMVDCFLLLFLKHRKNVFHSKSTRGTKYKPNLNDFSDIYDYFKEMGIYINNDKDIEEIKDALKVVENNTKPTLKKTRSFKKRVFIDDEGKKTTTMTPRGKMFGDTIYGVYKKDRDVMSKGYEVKGIVLEKDKDGNDIKQDNVIVKNPNTGEDFILDKKKKNNNNNLRKMPKGAYIENITNKEENLYLGKKVSKNKYHSKKKGRNASDSVYFYLNERGEKISEVINKFDMIATKDECGNVGVKCSNQIKRENNIPSNAIRIAKKDVFNFSGYIHRFKGVDYKMNSLYKINAINEKITVTEISTNLSYDGAKDKAEFLISNKIAFKIKYEDFYREFGETIHLVS